MTSITVTRDCDERDREDDREAAEQDPHGGDGDQHEQRRQADRVTEHTGHDQVVLEQPHDEHADARRDRDCHESVSADADRERARRERADHRHDLDDPGEGADEDQVRHADRPERERQHGADERDQQRLATDVRAELQVDQIPGVAQLLPLRPG